MSNGAILKDDSKCCRICHDQDLESCKELESPCHCSGSLKFAHRDCIQRWCEEKGNTTCEICLQKFEPGYISPAKNLQLIHTTDTARNEPEMEENVEGERSRCAEYRRLLAILFTLVLLIKNLFDMLSGDTQAYPFSLVTVVIVKATGIIVPMYLLFRITATISNSIKHQHHLISNWMN